MYGHFLKYLNIFNVHELVLLLEVNTYLLKHEPFFLKNCLLKIV
jgi:hypothetical protein